MSNILIIGATSAIAEETARIWAERGDRLYLIARNTDRCSVIASDIRARGADEVVTAQLDIRNTDQHEAILARAFSELGHVDTALIAHGTLPDQARCDTDTTYAISEFELNATATISLMIHIGTLMKAQSDGTLAVISSVAGDRGRQSNYLYGSAKAAVSTFAQGLRNRLNDAGVHVLTIKPGMVDSPMTVHMDKGPLFTSTGIIARGIVNAVDKKKDVVYLPGYWRFVLFIICRIPERIFKRLKL